MLPSPCLVFTCAQPCVSFLPSRAPHWLSNPGWQNTVHQLAVPGEDFKCCPGILVLELPRKAQHSQALDGAMLCSQRGETKRISSGGARQSLVASRAPPRFRDGRLACVHPSFLEQQKDPDLKGVVRLRAVDSHT